MTQDRNNEESFWEDVDAIRAMLDAEDASMGLPDPMEGFTAASFQEEKAAFRPRPGQQRGSGDGAPRSVSQETRRPAPRPMPRQQMAPPRRQMVPPRQQMVPPRQKQVQQKKVRTQDPKALIISLYVIIAAELAGLLAVGTQWYLWMK